ncbi:hypothetical protein MHH81_07395 [Psychrobacillus sp. FSL H8-0484]|uniref:hypothetical protein n=1 Tax=Psychrobacillus sp. FSL H8-0484 TaxID=2921390 RepID=UPI0030F53FC0
MFKNKFKKSETGLFILLLTCFLLIGCSQENQVIEEKEAVIEDSNTITMPEAIPSDFDFIVEFGVRKRNVINTYEDTVTKDLVADGTVTTNLTFTTEEMDKIYQKMKEINITGKKNTNPQTNCLRIPFSEDEWEITINGGVITHTVSEQYCSETSDDKQLIELRNYVFSLVKNKDEYKKLPEAEGGYR